MPISNPAVISITTELIKSDILRNSNDAEKTTSQASYTKVKEVLLNADLPSCRIKFDGMNIGMNSLGRCKVYKNGIAEGAESSIAGEDTWITKSGDFSGFVSGDLIQVYAYRAGATVAIKNMKFYYSEWITNLGGKDLKTPLETTGDATISMTNQDP